MKKLTFSEYHGFDTFNLTFVTKLSTFPYDMVFEHYVSLLCWYQWHMCYWLTDLTKDSRHLKRKFSSHKAWPEANTPLACLGGSSIQSNLDGTNPILVLSQAIIQFQAYLISPKEDTLLMSFHVVVKLVHVLLQPHWTATKVKVRAIKRTRQSYLS